MTIHSRHDHAFLETTKPVLAEIVNEGLAYAKLKSTGSWKPQLLCLQSLNSQDGSSMKVAVKAGTVVEMRKDRVVSVVRADSLQLPIIITNTGHEILDPGTVFKILSILFKDVASETILDEMVRGLRSSAANQEKWLEVGQNQLLSSFEYSSADWEQALVYGHPTHPVGLKV